MVQDMALVVSTALLVVASASMSLVSNTLLMVRRISMTLTRSTTSPTTSPITCLTRRRKISTTDPLMTLSSQLLMALTTSTTVIKAAQTISTPNLSASAKLVVLALASRSAMDLILISDTLLVLSTMMMKLASVVTLTGLSLTSTPITAVLTPISTKLVSMTTSRSPRARCLKRKNSIHSFLKATLVTTHLSTTTSPMVVDMAADHMLSLSSTARAPSVTSKRTHSITSVVEPATEAMEVSAVVVPTTVVALRATPRHLSDTSVDLADSEKRTSRQKIQT